MNYINIFLKIGRMIQKKGYYFRTIAELFEYVEKKALKRIREMEEQGLIPRRDMDE